MLALSHRPTRLSPPVSQNIERVLQTIRSHLDMDVAFLSEFLGSSRVFQGVASSHSPAPVQAGQHLPMDVGYCEHVVEGRLPELIPDTSLLPLAQSIPETTTVPIGAHMSVPIHLRDGRLFGTFCCFSHSTRPELGEHDLDLLRTFAQLISGEISAEVEAADENEKIAGRIKSAISNGDPRIVFQPIVRLADMRFVGVEALARFESEPKRTPDVWFGEASSVGMGPELEMAAVRAALLQGSRLPERIAINVNLSPEAILTGDALSALKGIAPKRIVVEITEHAAVDDYLLVAEALKPLREAGMRVAIDDAGAGYASLRHILHLSPNIIKFDISLTRDIDKDPKRQAMIAALAEYAKRTSTRVVAEGVETVEELQTLVDLKIEKAQGYLFSRPKPMRQLLEEFTAKGERAYPEQAA